MRNPPQQDCWDPAQGGPRHRATVGAQGRVREGTWAFFSISELGVKTDLLKTIRRDLGRHGVGGSRRGTWSPHNQNDGERQWRGRGAWGAGSSFPQSPRASL